MGHYNLEISYCYNKGYLHLNNIGTSSSGRGLEPFSEMCTRPTYYFKYL